MSRKHLHLLHLPWSDRSYRVVWPVHWKLQKNWALFVRRRSQKNTKIQIYISNFFTFIVLELRPLVENCWELWLLRFILFNGNNWKSQIYFFFNLLLLCKNCYVPVTVVQGLLGTPVPSLVRAHRGIECISRWLGGEGYKSLEVIYTLTLHKRLICTCTKQATVEIGIFFPHQVSKRLS